MEEKDFSDEELAVLALKEESSFILLISRYKRRLFSYLRYLTRLGEDDIEDILQNIFIKIYYNLNDFDGGLKFSSWAYRIAHNEAISHLRKIKPSVSLSCESFGDIPDDCDISKELDIVFDNEKISKTVCEMDEKYREIIILKYFQQRDYKEISDILKKPMGTVATLVNRAKKQFKQKYQ